MQDVTTCVAAALAVLFIGISKAGFGGGLGMLVTPLCVLAFGPKLAIGVLLPLLCAGDVFSMYHYWGKWERHNLMFLLPGVCVGVVIGVQLIGRFDARGLNIAIGALAVVFVLFQIVKENIFKLEGAFKPNHKIGVPCGVGAGITSTFAHGAGPVVSVYLIPQKMPKEIYVGTTVLVFTWINWIKMPFFCIDRSIIDLPCFSPQAIITRQTLLLSAAFLPLIPVGVWLGIWLNRKVSEARFVNVIYLLTFLAGVELIIGYDFTRWFR